MQKVECYCLFDITNTGINGQSRTTAFPIKTKDGIEISNTVELNRCRNQQRNFDTLLQVISLRTQIFNIKSPIYNQGNSYFQGRPHWQFSFEIEPNSQWLVDNDDFWILKQDTTGTPMIIGLNETADLAPVLDATSATPNVIYHAQVNK